MLTIEHQSTEPKCLRCDWPHGDSKFFSFVPCSWQNKEHLSRTKDLYHLFKPQHQYPHSLYSSLYLLFGIDKKNMFNSCKVVIIFFILMVSINDFAVIKYREIRCWSPLGLKELRELYTAISIYIVGSKLQGYGTRLKGGRQIRINFRLSRLSARDGHGHRRSSLYGRGIVNFADNYSLRSHIPLRSCLVGLRLWSDNVNWNSCM